MHGDVDVSWNINIFYKYLKYAIEHNKRIPKMKSTMLPSKLKTSAV